MSVSELLRDRRVIALLEPCLPAGPIKLGMRLRARARRNSGGLVGTAFDYMVRFELQRRYPNARATRWVAEKAIARVGRPLGIAGASWSRVLRDSDGELVAEVAASLREIWEKITQDARRALTSYVGAGSPSRKVLAGMARHALRLARIDPFYRIGYSDPDPRAVDGRDVDDLIGLASIAPWWELGSRRRLWLNPGFGKQERRVGGADVDLISDDRLIDIKTVTQPNPRADLRQLLAYAILARAERTRTRRFPRISIVCVYYARQGHMWTVPIPRRLADDSSASRIAKDLFAIAREAQ